MSVIADEAACGRGVVEASKAMADRLDMQDPRFLAVAATIQRSSGGNLAEVLARLSKVIRSRFRLFRHVKAITAEAKRSGWVLSAFPVGALIVLHYLAADLVQRGQGNDLFHPHLRDRGPLPRPGRGHHVLPREHEGPSHGRRRLSACFRRWGRSGYAALADEYEMASQEIRAKKERSLALRDMGIRAGVSDVSNFVTVLIQSAAFGTSVAEAPRV